MPSSRAVFDLNNRKSEVNRHLKFYPLKKKSKICLVWVGAYFNSEMCRVGVMVNTRHISEFFWKWTKPQVPIHSRFADFFSSSDCRIEST